METVRSVLELAYFASGPLILIVACIGLYQLKITKETARLNAQRDSLRLTADQCEYYQSQIIPLQSILDKTIKEKGISFFQKAEIDIHEEAIRIRMNLEADELKTELNKIQTISKELVAVYNAMEAFALFFVSGVADERVAFSAVGKTYCYSIRKYLPDLVPVSATQGVYKNITKLFLIWNARFEKQKLVKHKDKIEEQLSKVRDRFIKPVGTE